MSQRRQSLDVIPEKTWPHIRALYDETRHEDLKTVFGTRLRGETIEAYLSHRALEPLIYGVLCPPVDEEDHRKFFGIAISNNAEFGVLRVQRMSDTPIPTTERESRRIQAELGLDLPNPQDFRDFHEVITHSYIGEFAG